METNKLIAGIVAAAIAVIVLAGVLMPALTEATTTTDKFVNNGLFEMDLIDDTLDGYTASWDYTDPAKMTINDTVVNMSVPTTIAQTIYGNDDFFCRYYYQGTTSFIQVYKVGSASAVYSASIADSRSMDITISNGTITFDNGVATPYTVTFTSMYAIVEKDGDYVMKPSTESAYLNGDSQIFAHGETFVLGVTFRSIIEGTIDDGFIKSIWPDTVPITTGDMTNDSAVVSSHNDLYTMTKFNFDVTNTNTSATATVTYSQFIVPHEVTAERSVHLTDAMNVVLNVIPLLIIVAVLLGVVAVFILRRE